MHEEDIDFEEERVNDKGPLGGCLITLLSESLLVLFNLEEKTVHARVGLNLAGGGFSALEFHSPAAVGEIFVPAHIIMLTPVA